MLVIAVVVPEVPVMVTVTAEDVTCADALAVNVSTWVPDAEPAAKDDVTPFGSPLAASATVPEKPPKSATVIVLVTLPPCATETLTGAGDNVKPGAVVTVKFSVSVTVIVSLSGGPGTVAGGAGGGAVGQVDPVGHSPSSTIDCV